MGVIQCALDVVDCSIWHAATLEDIQPFVGGLLLGDLFDHPIYLLPVLHAVTVGDKPRIRLPLWMP